MFVVNSRCKNMDDTDFYGVGLLNDDTHSFKYVIDMLVKLCGVTPERGLSMAREIHRIGKGIVFSGTRDECENMLGLVSEYGPDPLVPNSSGSIAGYIERNAKPNIVTNLTGNRVPIFPRVVCFVFVFGLIGALFAIPGGVLKKPESPTNTSKPTEVPTARPLPGPTWFSCGRNGKSYIIQYSWKNVGDRPIRTVYIDWTVYNKDGVVVHTLVDYPIYSVPDSQPGVAPGETYRPGPQEGYVIPFGDSSPDAPHRCTGRITRTTEAGIK
jgi:ATP-dependent Clp protease adaptor protein ClpS